MVRKLSVDDRDALPLSTDHRVRKLDHAGYGVRVRRTHAHSAIAVDHFYMLQDPEELARRLELFDPRALDHVDEGFGAAVQNRDLQRIYVDYAIVDVAPGQRRQQVLDGRDHHALTHQGRRITH